jgi:acyl-coenzyme A thioesterase 13
MNVPVGFQPLFRTSPAIDLIGPIYCKGSGRDLVLGLRVEKKHCNARDIVHGGILATLADLALGYTTAFANDTPQAMVTVNLSLDYAGNAKVGDWLEAAVEVQKLGARLAFANGYIRRDSEPIVRASAVFMLPAAKGAT